MRKLVLVSSNPRGRSCINEQWRTDGRFQLRDFRGGPVVETTCSLRWCRFDPWVRELVFCMPHSMVQKKKKKKKKDFSWEELNFLTLH